MTDDFEPDEPWLVLPDSAAWWAIAFVILLAAGSGVVWWVSRVSTPR